MSGTLIQLSALGVQDIYLRISPEYTLFKRTFKRHTNFAVEALAQDFTGTLDWDKSVNCQLARNGDLCSEAWLVTYIGVVAQSSPLPGDFAYFTNGLANAMIEDVTFTIGGNTIQQHSGEFLELAHEFLDASDETIDVSETQFRSPSQAQLEAWTADGTTFDEDDGSAVIKLYTPLQLYFSRARSQALPIISLQYHDIRIKIKTKSLANVLVKSRDALTTTGGAMSKAHILVNYVFLDAQERRLFAANSHEYLISQVQLSDAHTKTSGLTTLDCNLSWNHPVSDFFFVVQRTALVAGTNPSGKDYFNYERTAGEGDDTFTSAVLKLNSFNREDPKEPLFFRVVQPSIYYPRTPKKNVYAYSFAAHPSEWWPSGSLNFSRIDKATMRFTFPATDKNAAAYGEAEVRLYARNYNVLRVQAGMAAVKYAN